MKEQNIVRTVLKNEITWIVMIVATIWGCVQTVILPIQSLQFQITQLQVAISEIKTYDTRITQNSNDILVLKQVTKNLK